MRQRGFTSFEMAIVMFVTAVLAVFGLPSLKATQASNRIWGDARSIAAELTLAKMRAASAFSRSRLSFNAASGTYQVETLDRTAGAYRTEGATQRLSSGVSFGYGGIATAAGSQASIQQSSPITFNSRSLPVDGGGALTTNNAVYLNNGSAYYAVTVSISGRVVVWRYGGTAWQAAR